MRYNDDCYHFLLALVLTLFSQLAHADLARFAWQGDDRAAYYILSVQNGGQSYFIRTSGQHVYLDSHIYLKIEAFSQGHRRLGPIDSVFKIVMASDPTTETDEGKDAKSPLPVAIDIPEPAPATENTRVAIIESVQVPAEPDPPSERLANRKLSFSPGLGSETLTASGGSSRFKSGANFVDLLLQFSSPLGAWQFAGGQSVNLSLRSKSVESRHQARVIDGEVLKTGRKSYRRSQVSSTIARSIAAMENVSIDLIYGLAAAQSPMMSVYAAQTASADLSLRYFSGPVLGLSFTYHPAQGYRLDAKFAQVPFSFSAKNFFSESRAQIQGSMDLNANLYLGFLVAYEQDQYAMPIDCANTFSGTCKTPAKTTSVDGNLGLSFGLYF